MPKGEITELELVLMTSCKLPDTLGPIPGGWRTMNPRRAGATFLALLLHLHADLIESN